MATDAKTKEESQNIKSGKRVTVRDNSVRGIPERFYQGSGNANFILYKSIKVKGGQRT